MSRNTIQATIALARRRLLAIATRIRDARLAERVRKVAGLLGRISKKKDDEK